MIYNLQVIHGRFKMKYLPALLSLILSSALVTPALTRAQTANLNSETKPSNSLFRLSPDISKRGFFSQDAEWFFSAGFNKAYYSTSNINVNQPSLGNNFSAVKVEGHDEFQTPGLRTPDNWKVGRFIDDQKAWAVDLSLDHVKYTMTQGQTALITGKITQVGALGTGNQNLNQNTFTYMLHNGLNHFMVDLIYREALIGSINESSSLAFIGKLGTGLAIVHPENTIDNYSSDVGAKSITHDLGTNNGWWRIVGSSTGFDVGLRYVFKKPFYVELSDKSIYTNMRNIPVYQGSATQNLWSNEITLNFGYTMGN